MGINLWISGANPDSFHLVNRLLHVLICLGIFWTLRRLIPEPRSTAFFASLLFAVHPIQVEAITYLTGRFDALAMLFFVYAWFYFIRSRLSSGPPSIKPYVLSLLFYTLALYSKENAITWLGVVFLTELVYFAHGDIREFLRRLRQDFWRVYPGYFALTIGYLVVRSHILRILAVASAPFTDNPLVNPSFLIRVLTPLKVLFQSLGLFFWPIHFSSDYSYNQIPLITRWNSPAALVVFLLTAVLLLLLAWSYRRLPPLFFGLGFFLVTYSVVSNIVIPIGTIRADRFLYLPGLGLCLLVGWAVARWEERFKEPGRKRTLQVSFAALLLMLAVRTIVRNGDWKNNFSLFLSAAEVSPRSAKSQMNLGAMYLERGELALAEQRLQLALSIDPNYSSALSVMGVVLLQEGKLDEAVPYFRRALKSYPNNLQASINLGMTMVNLGNLSEAIETVDAVLRQHPDNAEAHACKGLALEKQGKTKEALSEYEKAIQADPGDTWIRNNLNQLLQKAGQPAVPQNNTPQ
jgi:Flp pilus assembly protein TadD